MTAPNVASPGRDAAPTRRRSRTAVAAVALDVLGLGLVLTGLAIGGAVSFAAHHLAGWGYVSVITVSAGVAITYRRP